MKMRKNNKRYVQVTFGDEVKLLRFNFNAVADTEEYFGRGIGYIFKEEQVGFSLCRALYWAGLKWKDPGLTIQRTGQMLQEKMEQEGIGVAELMPDILKALEYGDILGGKKQEEEVKQEEVDTGKKVEKK